eukprot:GHRQ01033273.1.p2 GENE.GHRQ01033273.1~~GHRQ01033273.1.p2  ORF type:complete len:108 (-),score=12.94 GHRQ01033273.1:50-373(-)
MAATCGARLLLLNLGWVVLTENQHLPHYTSVATRSYAPSPGRGTLQLGSEHPLPPLLLLTCIAAVLHLELLQQLVQECCYWGGNISTAQALPHMVSHQPHACSRLGA